MSAASAASTRVGLSTGAYQKSKRPEKVRVYFLIASFGLAPVWRAKRARSLPLPTYRVV